MEFSKNGLELLKVLEGFRAKTYRDAAGVLTVGYGHVVKRGDGIPDGDVISTIKAEEMLKQDVQDAVDCVNEAVVSPLTQNQFDALVIFVYNVGANAFHHSYMLQMLNKPDYEAAANQFPKWNKVRNKGMYVELAGLTNRRKAEQKLFLEKE